MKGRIEAETAMAENEDSRGTGRAPQIVSDQLRKAILAGAIAPGAQLRQDELAERYGTSRIPVREALRQLEAEGLVTIQPNRGAVVTSLSLDEVLEMLEIRIALECRALRLAIPNMVEEDLDHAAELLRSYDNEPLPEKWGEMNWHFHRALYAPCDLPKLIAMIEANYGQVGRFTRLQVSLAAGKEKPQAEHYNLLKACRSGDVKTAVALLEEHIQHTQKSLMAAVRHKNA